MKIAVLADIHGNGQALRAVLNQAGEQNVGKILVLGDIVGYYYDIQGVLSSLSKWDVVAIGGNHERLLAESLEDSAIAKQYRSKYGSALDVARDVLSDAEMDWLSSLPERRTEIIDGTSFELCHGSPTDCDQYIYANSSRDRIDACIVPDRDFVLLGHTHRPMLVSKPGCVILNPGSVGQSRDIGGFAAWCLIDTDTRAVGLMRTAYDVQDLIKETTRRDPDLPYLRDILVRGNPYAASLIEGTAGT